MNITTNQKDILIPFEDAIALYPPVELAKQHCPEILRNGDAIASLAAILSED